MSQKNVIHLKTRVLFISYEMSVDAYVNIEGDEKCACGML